MSGLVDSIIDMAKRLDLKIIAEGIETPGQDAYLGERGVDYGQGWYYSRAMPAMGFIEFVRTFNKSTP
jgi:sensor c-di-GMP phosphodiesterase-like protein